MTIEPFTPLDAFTVAGIGPYEIGHPYRRSAEFVVTAFEAGTFFILGNEDWNISPEQSTTTGDLTLTVAAAAEHDGRDLFIVRRTAVEQGWVGLQGNREKGLETQLDHIAMALQDLGALASRSLTRVGAGTGIPVELLEGRLLIAGAGGDSIQVGPTADAIEDAQANADRAQQMADRVAALSEITYLNLYALRVSNDSYNDDTIVRTLEEGFAYRAVASGGHITNAEGQAFEVLPFRSGAYNLKAFGAVGDGVADDTAPTQAAINACANDEYVLVPRGLYQLTAPVAMKSRVSMECGGKWSAGFFGDFNGPLFYSTTQMWRNAFRNIQFRNNHDGPLVACLSYTGYQSMVQECRFECNHGKAVALNGQGYSVENKIRDCYFYGCRYGIYAVTGTHANTDAWVIDNYFYGNGRQVNAIYWETPSGGVFRGNHPYGGTLNGHYFEFVAGLNVSVLDNYFEDDTEPRIKIQLGNPSSYIIGGNKFWQGDGSGTDANGNKQSLIELECAPGVPQVVGLNGNIFEAGENSVDILRTNIDVGNEAFKTVDINLSGNVYNGSYNLGTNTQRVVETDWLGLAKAHTDQNPLIGVSSPIERYTFDGAGTGTPGLPNNTILEGKSFKLRNEGRALLTLSTARVVKGSKKIPPFSEFQISMIDGEYFVLGAPTPLPPTELSVSAGSVDVSRSYHTLDTEANAATDDLFSMTGGHDGMRVLLRAADNARTVTLKDGGGNLRLNGDFALDTVVDAIELIYDASLSLWVEISRSNNA